MLMTLELKLKNFLKETEKIRIKPELKPDLCM